MERGVQQRYLRDLNTLIETASNIETGHSVVCCSVLRSHTAFHHPPSSPTHLRDPPMDPPRATWAWLLAMAATPRRVQSPPPTRHATLQSHQRTLPAIYKAPPPASKEASPRPLRPALARGMRDSAAPGDGVITGTSWATRPR